MLSEAQKDKALRAMEGARPKFRPGKYGKQYDTHTCGNCGRTVRVEDNYCGGCGFRILWDNPRCLTDYHTEGEDDKREDVCQSQSAELRSLREETLQARAILEQCQRVQGNDIKEQLHNGEGERKSR